MSSIYDFPDTDRRLANYKLYVKVIPEWRVPLADILANDFKFYGRVMYGSLSLVFHIYQKPNRHIELTFYREFIPGDGGSDTFFNFGLHDAVSIFPELRNTKVTSNISEGWFNVENSDAESSSSLPVVDT